MAKNTINISRPGNDVVFCRQFFKEDLKKDAFSYESHYHKDDDLISVHDLWHFWVLSEGATSLSLN